MGMEILENLQDTLECPNCIQCPACLQLYLPNETHNCRYLQQDNYAKEFLLIYRCIRCNKSFSGLSNVGMHKCKFHPGKIGRDGRYSCCGATRLGVTSPYVHNHVWSRQHQPFPKLVDLSGGGCTPCDHAHPDNPVKMPIKATNPAIVSLLGEMEPPIEQRPGYNADTRQLEAEGDPPG